MDQKVPGVLPNFGYYFLYGGALIQLNIVLGENAGLERTLLLISWMMLCYLVVYIIKTHTLGNRKMFLVWLGGGLAATVPYVLYFLRAEHYISLVLMAIACLILWPFVLLYKGKAKQ